MAAVAERTKIADLLEDQSLLVADVLKTVAELDLARAWARGEVEFGRVKHCVTGRPGVPESMPTLLIEDGIAWEGKKTPAHGKFSVMLADSKKLPDCRKYLKYVAETKDGETRWKTVEIQRDEATKLMALHVQLTDKGLAGD